MPEMLPEDTDNLTIANSAQSIKILTAQHNGNIYWAVLCSLALLIGALQLVTIALWRPLRKAENCIIVALAVADILKTAGFGALAIRRLIETSLGSDDASTQRRCIVWLSFMVFPLNSAFFLILTLSIDRFLALAAPVWYKMRSLKVKLCSTVLSVMAGCTVGSGMYIGASDTTLIPLCAYATSPTEAYTRFAKYFETSCVLFCLGLNAISCVLLLFRWRDARKRNMDVQLFKKTVQMGALRTLLAVVLVYLLTTATSVTYMFVLNSSGLDAETRMSYTPIGASFEILRGVLDFPLYVLLVKEYRNGFKEVILKRCCGFLVTQVVPSTNT